MKWNPVQESIWLLPSKHSEGPCCFLQYNSTAVTLGGCDTLVSCLPEQLTATQLNKLQSSKAVSLKERERALTAERMQHFMDLPLKHRGIRLQLWHAHIMCRVCNCSAVHCYRKCQAMENRRQEGVKMGWRSISFLLPDPLPNILHQKGLIPVLYSFKICHLWHGHGGVYAPQIAS